jgi:hypothetical protein
VGCEPQILVCVIVGFVEIFIYVEATLPLETQKLHKYLGWDYFVGYFVLSHDVKARIRIENTQFY